MTLLILAAGEGKRLRPYTHDRPKCMVTYQGKPIIDYILQSTKAIPKRYIVGGYKYSTLYNYLNMHVSGFFENCEYHHSNMVYSMLKAKELFDDDLIVSYSDIIYPSSFIMPLLDTANDIDIIADRHWLQLWQKRFDNPLDDCESFRYNKNKFLYDIGNKCSSTDETMAGYIGLIKFSKNVLQFIKNMDFDKDMYMTDLLQELLKTYKIKVHLVDEPWLEIDSTDDLRVNIKLGSINV